MAKHPLTQLPTAEIREHVAGYEAKIAYNEARGVDQSDRRTVLADLLTELNDRESDLAAEQAAEDALYRYMAGDPNA